MDRKPQHTAAKITMGETSPSLCEQTVAQQVRAQHSSRVRPCRRPLSRRRVTCRGAACRQAVVLPNSPRASECVWCAIQCLLAAVRGRPSHCLSTGEASKKTTPPHAASAPLETGTVQSEPRTGARVPEFSTRPPPGASSATPTCYFGTTSRPTRPVDDNRGPPRPVCLCFRASEIARCCASWCPPHAAFGRP